MLRGSILLLLLARSIGNARRSPNKELSKNVVELRIKHGSPDKMPQPRGHWTNHAGNTGVFHRSLPIVRAGLINMSAINVIKVLD